MNNNDAPHDLCLTMYLSSQNKSIPAFRDKSVIFDQIFYDVEYNDSHFQIRITS